MTSRANEHPDSITSDGRLAATTLFLYLLLAMCSCQAVIDKIGGDFAGPPAEMNANISPGARQLIVAACEGIDPNRFADMHLHGISGVKPHPSWRTWWHPWRRMRTLVYLSAAGVKNEATVEQDYADRLFDLIDNFPIRGRFFVYAMDRFYREDGTCDPERTSVYVPNELVMALARRQPDRIVPVISVHPYRRDAVAELDRWARQGCRYVKWFPNAMGIDPSSPLTDPFYAKMREFDMVLLSHTGSEKAVDTWGLDHLGNPLLLRRPLGAGVRVAALHCGHSAKYFDPTICDSRSAVGSELFLTMMSEPAYADLLYGDISSLTFTETSTDVLREIIVRRDLHDRLAYGSDYPICAINIATWPSRFVRAGMLREEEAEQLTEIYRYNPLLFNFVLNRTLRHPTTGQRLSNTVFYLPKDWPTGLIVGEVKNDDTVESAATH